NLNVNSITFTAPTNVSGLLGLSAVVPRATTGNKTDPKNGLNHGKRYTLQAVDKSGKLHAYTGTGNLADGTPNGLTVTIQYQLPDDAHLKHNDATGKEIVYSALLHAADLDTVANHDCGNAAWAFTHDGKGAPTSGCGENSFVAGVFPNGVSTSPGQPF